MSEIKICKICNGEVHCDYDWCSDLCGRGYSDACVAEEGELHYTHCAEDSCTNVLCENCAKTDEFHHWLCEDCKIETRK